MMKMIINGLSSVIYFGMSIWEYVTVSNHPSMERNINDLVMCFLYTIATMNMFMGITSFYIFIIQCKEDDKSEKNAITMSTGISIWGIILFFRYSPVLYDSYYYPILYTEMILFFTRIGMVLLLGCGSCIKTNEVDH
jgi:hypothetical protein